MLERLTAVVSVAAVSVMLAVAASLPPNLPLWEEAAILVFFCVVLDVMWADWSRYMQGLQDRWPKGE